MAASGTNLYVGGEFTQAGLVSANRVARWDGTAWSRMGRGATTNGVQNGGVEAMAVSGTNVYVGGTFGMAGGIPANAIARFDGSNWFALGNNVNSTVLALAANGNDVYAGGYFTNASGISASRIAKWDGANWSALGTGLGNNPSDWVAAIAVNGTHVYASGIFTNAGATAVNYIAHWNGSIWEPMGSGTSIGSPPAVYGLAAGDGKVYAGGVFFNAGQKPSALFGIWNEPGAISPIAIIGLLPSGSLLFAWTSISNLTYRILSTANLTEPFTPFSGPIFSSGIMTSFTNSAAAGASRFFLIEQLAP